MTERMWDARYAELAEYVSQWSKDPNAQVGAVVTDKRHRVVALGYNGFPVGVEDSAERWDNKQKKNDMVVHAEENAILIAGAAAEGGTIYVYGKPVCSRCAGVIIQAGIRHVVAEPPQAGTASRWHTNGQIAQVMFTEANVAFHPLPVEPKASQDKEPASREVAESDSILEDA